MLLLFTMKVFKKYSSKKSKSLLKVTNLKILYLNCRSYEGAHICQLLQNHPGLQQLCGAMAG